MNINYQEIDINTYNLSNNKPSLYERDNGYPFERLNPFAFEDLTYFVIKQCIEKERHWNNFDSVQGLGGIKDKGRDCILKNNNLNLGLVQCKHSEKLTKLSKPILIKEIVKFLLYSIKQPELIYKIDEFKYYIFSSSGLSNDAKDLVDNFNEKILHESNLGNWVNSVIKQYSTISDLKNYDNVKSKLNSLLLNINVNSLNVKDFNLLLNNKYNSNIVQTFFSVKKVIDEEHFERILDLKLKSSLSYNESISKIKSASIDLSRINNYFGSIIDSHIEREETNLLFEWVLTDLPKNKKGIAILEANAGLGKTVVLRDLYHKLEEIDIPVLSIKSDKYYANDRVSLEKKLFQSENVSIDSLIETIGEVDQKLVVLVDQLDALSQTLSTERDYMTTYNRLIHDLSVLPNVRVIISVRTFDLNYDSDLRVYKSPEFSNYKLKPLSEDNVKKILVQLKINRPSKQLIELLRTPSNLNVFCKLKELSKHNTDSLKTLNDLHNALWNQLIIKSSEKGLAIRDFLYKVAVRMYEFQQITITNVFGDVYYKEISFLKSHDILIEHNNNIQFFHQSFYDFVYAKQFVENENSVIEYIAENGQSLYVRQVIKMVIEYLREHNHPVYFETFKEILTSNKYRFHLKMLLISSLCLESNPSKREHQIFKQFIDKDDALLDVFISLVLSNGWIQYFIDSKFLNSIIKTEDKNKKNLSFKLLMNNLGSSSNEIIDYLESNSDIDNYDDSYIKRLLTYFEDWKNEKLLRLFNKHFCFEANSDSRHDNFWYYKTLEKIAIHHPKEVFKQLKDILNKIFKEKNSFNSLSYDLKTILEKIYKIHSSETFDFLFDFMNECVNKHKLENIYYPNYTTSLYKGFYFSDVGIKSSSENADDEIFNILKNHLINQSNSNLVGFKKFVEQNIDSNSIPILKLCSIGLHENPRSYLNYIYKLIWNVYIKNGFNGWDDKFQWQLRQLLSKSFEYFSDSQKETVVQILLSIKPFHEFRVMKSDNKMYHSLRYSGDKQYVFINAIPNNLIYNNTQLKKRFLELKRKFGEPKKDRVEEGRVISYSVGAPYSEEVYKKMTIDNWRKSFLKFNDNYQRDRFDSPSKGGTLEHARAFEKEVEQRPIFFSELISDIVEYRTVSNAYVIHGISGLINSKYDACTILNLIKKVIRYEDMDLSDTIRTIWHLDYLIKTKLVDNDIIEYLSYLALNHEHPSKPLNPSNPKFDSLNSVRGAALDKLISCSYDENFKERIFEVVEKAMYDEQLSVRVSILSNIAYLNNLDLERAFLMFQKMTDTDEVELIKNSLWSADFYKNKYFDRMRSYFEKIIQNEELHEKGVILICKSWINDRNMEGSFELLQIAIGSSEKARCAIIQTAEHNLIDKNGEINKKCYELLIDLLQYDGDEMASRYSGLILRKFKSNTFNIALPFLREYVKSNHARKEPAYLFNYLNSCSDENPIECLELMKEAMYIDDRSIQNRGYFDKEPVQVILSIYSALNKKYHQNTNRLNETLDLFDILLQNNRMRGFATEAINTL